MSKRRIKVLDDITVNKIAAGEVIENPSSVVKELVENALDSGASEIIVEIKAGGRQLIKVVDNGCGISHDDALLALERHATSKIESIDDLFKVATMGFRGEALPSIASISKFTLKSFDGNSEFGTEIFVDGGKIFYAKAIGHPIGTTIEVKSLFFNVPVRRNFLRSVMQDTIEVQRVVTALALANPNIRFKFINDQKEVFFLSTFNNVSFKDALKERIAFALGGDIKKKLIYVSYKEDYFELEGFIIDPAITRPNRTGQYLFVNNRSITSKVISLAVLNGFGTRIEPRRFPMFVLHLKIKAQFIDVNVHPQKKEVRFSEESLLRSFVIRAIERSLDCDVKKDCKVVEENYELIPQEDLPLYSFRTLEPQKYYNDNFVKIVEGQEATNTNDIPSLKEILNVSGVCGKYILAKNSINSNKLKIIDSHRALLRINYDYLLKTFEDNKNGIESYDLLVPFAVEFSRSEVLLICNHIEALNDFGVRIKPFGGNSFVVDSIPSILKENDIKELLYFILDELNTVKDLGDKKNLALSLAKKSVFFKKNLTVEEALIIIEKLEQSSNSSNDPLGRSIAVQIDDKSIEKMFL